MAITRFLDGLFRACGALAAVCLVAIAVLVLTSIFGRLFGVYIAGLNAYAGYMMAASSFFALAYAFRRGGHIRVNLLLTKLKGRVRWAVELWCLAAASGLTIYLAWYSIRMVSVSLDFGDVSEGPDATPLWIPQLAMAIGSTIFALCLVESFLVALFTGRVEDSEGDVFGPGMGPGVGPGAGPGT